MIWFIKRFSILLWFKFIFIGSLTVSNSGLFVVIYHVGRRGNWRNQGNCCLFLRICATSRASFTTLGPSELQRLPHTGGGLMFNTHSAVAVLKCFATLCFVSEAYLDRESWVRGFDPLLTRHPVSFCPLPADHLPEWVLGQQTPCPCTGRYPASLHPSRGLDTGMVRIKVRCMNPRSQDRELASGNWLWDTQSILILKGRTLIGNKEHHDNSRWTTEEDKTFFYFLNVSHIFIYTGPWKWFSPTCLPPTHSFFYTHEFLLFCLKHVIPS